MSEYTTTPTKNTENTLATFEYIGMIHEEDESTTIVARNPETGKIYKFTNCVLTGCGECSSNKVDTIDFAFNTRKLSDLPDSPLTNVLKTWLNEIGVSLETASEE